MMSPLGNSPIIYDRSYIVADRQAQQAYLCGVDKDKRLYVVSIGYTERPAPLTLYYTDPQPACGFYVPVLIPQGNLAIIGGSSKTDYDSDNFTPTASAWLIPLGRQDDVTSAVNRWPVSLLWWLLTFVAVLLVSASIVVYWRRKKVVLPVRQTERVESREEPSELEADSNKKNEELLERICLLMDERQIFRNSELKLADVTAALDSNSRYVTDCIKECRGMTFIQFVNEYRVGYVQRLLRLQPDMKVFEAYTSAGFTSERSFFRIFKDVTGMTTSEWLSRFVQTGE
jgi:AraC-like DNA-binding protein